MRVYCIIVILQKKEQSTDIEANIKGYSDTINYPALESLHNSIDISNIADDLDKLDYPDGSYIDINQSSSGIVRVRDPKNAVTFYVPLVRGA